MAPVVQLARLVWSGTLFGEESWSCSVHLHNAGSAVPMSAAAYSDAIEAWVNRAGSNLSNAAFLTEVKLNRIDPVTGRYSEQTSNNVEVNPTENGAMEPAPGQLSLVVSLRTALTRGRGHAGRFYPPIGRPPAVDSATGATTLLIAQDTALSAAQLLTAINAVDPAFSVVVFSRAGQLVQPVTHVQVGRIYDTMRSRRRSLAEAPASSPVT